MQVIQTLYDRRLSPGVNALPFSILCNLRRISINSKTNLKMNISCTPCLVLVLHLQNIIRSNLAHECTNSSVKIGKCTFNLLVN